jgi:hypothetical protein
MTRLLIQKISDNPFGGELEEKGIFKTFNEAVDASLTLIDDITIKAILVNDGPQWVRIK